MELTLTETKVVVLVLLGLVKLFSGLDPLLATKLFKKRSDFWFKRFIGELHSVSNYNSLEKISKQNV